MGYVLVVENDESICELLHIVLSEEGYDVRCATTIGAALELVQQHQPSVILFDMKVSDGDGAAFVSRYHHLHKGTARLVAVSGLANLEAEAARIGADDYLSKPFELDALLSIVARAFARDRQA